MGGWYSANLATAAERCSRPKVAPRPAAWLDELNALAGRRRDVCRHFSAALHEVPAEIDAADGRWLALGQWVASLGAAPRVVEIGCGRGRYLRRLAEAFPHSELMGIDASAALLRDLPPQALAVRGDMLAVPLRDGSCDGAFCVEALEHALLPRRAVAALCRVVRPGGGVLVIDKNAAYQPLSDCQPWERWFTDHEMTQWLGAHGTLVTAQAIAHGNAARPSGLFRCWTAVRSA